LEDAGDVYDFVDELCQELKPIGPLEEDQVATIAKLLWRKHRLRIFLLAEQARAESHRQRMEKIEAAFASPDEKLARALAEACKKDDSVEDEERLQDLADLRKLNLPRYIQDLEMMERLDAAVERAVGRLQKYQTWRRTGSLARPAAEHRARRWGRVRQ